MSSNRSNTYRPRQQSNYNSQRNSQRNPHRTPNNRNPHRTPSCGYCKEDGHWMKHRDGTVICPKLQEKQRRKQQTNHRAAQARRSAISSGEWVSAQQTRRRTQTEQQRKPTVTQNRFEIPSDSESDDESEIQMSVAKPRVAQGAWANGVNAQVKAESEVKDSEALIKKRSDLTRVYLNDILEQKRKELEALDRESKSWSIKQEIDDLEEEIETLEKRIKEYE